ncbi:McrC family protein [Peristeroidobacter soli]|uniref:McrC family protein n=1 Tax=Peristeroidobacter soli TaxID=2497877 RepID=UPI00101C2F97|nr:restriction endonuclease [Peristeroidobacter soli]
MIRRTILEWQSIRYGEDEACLPVWAADRLGAVARRSGFGGEEGARVLTLGRTEARAAQVVGVIAAPGCALEILPKIDVGGPGEEAGRIRRQLVHMLAVAWNLPVDAGAMTALGWQRDNPLEVLIGLFARKLADALREGITRRYVGMQEDLPALQGRMNVARQFTTLAASPHRLACRYDVLSPDIALNRIMKAAVRRLLPLSHVSETQRRLREIDFVYADIAEVPVSALRWDEVVIDRTNLRWKELSRLAKLLLGERFQNTSLGAAPGISLSFEMNTLFERYIARLLGRALSGTDRTVHVQGGRLHCLERVSDGQSLFMTKPDILIMHRGRCELVIDTKWKRLSHLAEDPKRGVSQADVYQMMGYARIYRCEKLLLLYPHHAGLADRQVTAHHRIAGGNEVLSMATIDVSGSAGRVVADLRRLVDDVLGVSTPASCAS